MNNIIATTVEKEGKISIPGPIRKVLKIRSEGDIVGFVLDGTQVILTKAEIVPVVEPFTDKEWKKLTELANKPGGKTFKSGDNFLKYHKKLCISK